jgi:hypothetical protein
MASKFSMAVRGFPRKIWEKKWVVFLFIIWELTKDRIANWANSKIDTQIENKTDRVIEITAHAVEYLASTPISWTIAVAILVVLAVFVHSYSRTPFSPTSLPATNAVDSSRLSKISNYHDWVLPLAYMHWAESTNEQGVFSKEFEQAASEGSVIVWGKRQFLNDAILEKIPADHWVKSCIEMDPVIYSDISGVPESYILENSRTQPRQKYDPNDFEFWNLKVTSSEMRTIWPTGNAVSSDKTNKSELPSTKYLPLNEAVLDAWERIRTLPKFDMKPSHSPEFESLRDYYEKEPAKLPGIAAQVIFNSADPPIPIEGIAPPRTAMEVIPQDKVNGYMFSDDAIEMFDIYDQEKPTSSAV